MFMQSNISKYSDQIATMSEIDNEYYKYKITKNDNF